MTTTPTNIRRTVRHALLAILSATLLAACGGGDHDAQEFDAAAATRLDDPGAAPTVNLEAAPAVASRAPMGGGRRAPICLATSPACQPNLPPTQ